MTTPLLYSHKAMWDKEEILSTHSPLRTEMEGRLDIQSTYLVLPTIEKSHLHMISAPLY